MATNGQFTETNYSTVEFFRGTTKRIAAATNITAVAASIVTALLSKNAYKVQPSAARSRPTDKATRRGNVCAALRLTGAAASSNRHAPRKIAVGPAKLASMANSYTAS